MGTAPSGSLLETLRASASPMIRHSLLECASERAGERALVVPSGFVRDQLAHRYQAELAARGMTILVDPDVTPARSGEPEPARPERPKRPRARLADRPLPTGVVAKLVAERGYFALTPTGERFEAEDVKGRLVMEPGSLGASGVPEAIVFTGLVTIWGNGARSTPVVETSLHQLARILRLTWSGRTSELIRRSVERLKTTTYRATIDGTGGGCERLFSLLDEIETTWTGPATSPYRQVRAVYSRTAMELVSAPRMLRPIDLDALRRLGPQRDLARRLFLFLEASTGHPASTSVEIVERIIDQRLATTLGTTASPNQLASQLHAAGLAVEAAAPRYATVRVIPRRKRCLAPSEPAYALRATRQRRTKAL
jgi:hypothetical protein